MRDNQIILSKQLQIYLLEEIKQINKKKSLNEIFDDWTWTDTAHLGLDVVSFASSFVPYYGTALSTTLDIANAGWYYVEGKELTAILYLIMAIPFVGDIFALPIQLALKAGGKGLMLIPGMKEAIIYLVKNSSFIKGFITNAVGKGTIKSIIKAGDEKIAKELAEASIKFIEKVEQTYAREGADGVGKLLENGLRTEAELGKLSSKISDKEAKELVNIIKQTEIQAGKQLTSLEAKKIAEEFTGQVLQRSLTAGEAKELSNLLAINFGKGSISISRAEVTKLVSEWIGRRFGVVAVSAMKRIIPKFLGDVGEEYYQRKFGKGFGVDDSATIKSETSKLDCPDDNIKKGCRGNNVRVIQGYISNLGYNIPVSGDFDSETENAVKKFQNENDLTPTGVVSYMTIAKIEQLLTTGKQTKEQLPLPKGPETSASVSLYENILRKRNKKLERLVFKELVR